VDEAAGDAEQPAADTEQEGGQQQAKEQQQQQQQQEQQAAAEDVEMADVAGATAGPAAAPAALQEGPSPTASKDAADTPAAAAGAATGVPGASQQSSPLALKPVTNGQSRKRPAADAADGERPAKVAASTAEQQQQQQQTPAVTLPMGGDAGTAFADLVTPTGTAVAAAADAADVTGSGLAAAQGALDPNQQQQQVLAVTPVAAAPKAADVAAAGVLLQRLVAVTGGMQLAGLELLHARLSRVVAANAAEQDRQVVLQLVGRVVAAVEQETATATAGSMYAISL
jgi:hypothetical protein